MLLPFANHQPRNFIKCVVFNFSKDPSQTMKPSKPKFKNLFKKPSEKGEGRRGFALDQVSR